MASEAPEAPLAPAVHRLYGPLSPAEQRILGPDAEHDGVRDDVQLRLAALHGNDGELAGAATVLARSLTRSAILGSRDTALTREQLDHLAAELDCYWATARTRGFEPLPTNQFEALIVNNGERLAAYLDFSAKASGTPSGGTYVPAAACKLAQASFPE